MMPERQKDERPIQQIEFAGDMLPAEATARNRLDDVTAQIRGCENVTADDEPRFKEAQKLLSDLRAEAQELKETITEHAAPRSKTAEKVRQILYQAGIKIADDIMRHGCTGLVGALMSIQEDDPSRAIESAKFVLKNMGGSRCGLTCYVSGDKYCLVHDTIGALEDGQAPQFADMYKYMTRELTDKERGHVELVESARRRRSWTEAKDLLTGQRIPEDVPVVSWDERDAGPLSTVAEAATLRDQVFTKAGKVREALSSLGLDCTNADEGFLQRVMRAASGEEPDEPAFECPEHGEIVWTCRFCVAALIVSGSMVPEITVDVEGAGQTAVETLTGEEAEEFLMGIEDADDEKVTVKAVVARYERRLTKV